jgi:hypothetical protein
MSYLPSGTPDGTSRRRPASTIVRLRVTVARRIIETDVNPKPPLGWRFWTLAGFPGDPLEPRPYGGSRCLLMTMFELDGVDGWLCVMERDGCFQFFTTHELFPCPDQRGVEAFAQHMIAAHAIQPQLL